MNSRLHVLFACLAVLGFARAEDYEVTVPAGTTNTIDQAFVTALGSKNLVKKGDGVLWSSPLMASYAGNITIEAGALMVSANGDLGADATSANPRHVDIQSGATLIVNTGADVADSAAGDALIFNLSIRFAGTGAAPWNAALYQEPTGRSQNKLFKSSAVLMADATFAPSAGLGSKGGALSMFGHTLTLRGNFQMSAARALHRDEDPIGDIVVESGTLMFNSYVSGDFGHASKTITIKNGATMKMYGALQVPLWKLVMEEGSTFLATGTPSEVAGAEAAKYNKWGGDVVWNTTVDDSVLNVNDSYLTFKGKVTGTGTIRADRRGTIVFEKTCAETVAVDTTNVRLVMPSVDNYWGHGGMKIGYRSDGSYDKFGPDRADVTWTYCAEGPGPQLGLVNWPLHNPETFRSCGYIWNREATNVSYSVFIGVPYQNYMYLDGVNVYNNKRDNWGGKYTMTLTPGPHSLDIATVAYGTNGPRSDNDKPNVSGVIMQDPGNGYLFTTDTVERATVVLENTTKAVNLTFGNNSVLDANGMPIELTDISGFVTISNTSTLAASTKVCKIKGTWTLKGAEIGSKQLTVLGDCPLTFENVTIAMTPAEVDAIPRTQKHWDLCSATSYSGFAPGQVLTGNRRQWKVVVDATGRPGLDYLPKGMVTFVR